MFGPWNHNLDLGFPNLARAGPGEVLGGCWTQDGGPKNIVLFGNGFEMGDCGISRDRNGLYGTQEVFGRAGSPQPLPQKWFLPTFPYFGKFGGRPLAPVYPLLALCGLIGAYSPVWGLRWGHIGSFP